MIKFKPDMSGEVVNFSSTKAEYPEQEQVVKTVSFAKTNQDIQQENFQKTLKTKEEIEKLYQGDENGVIDFDRISELNYQLMCQSLWLANITRPEYNRYNTIF